MSDDRFYGNKGAGVPWWSDHKEWQQGGLAYVNQFGKHAYASLMGSDVGEKAITSGGPPLLRLDYKRLVKSQFFDDIYLFFESVGAKMVYAEHSQDGRIGEVWSWKDGLAHFDRLPDRRWDDDEEDMSSPIDVTLERNPELCFLSRVQEEIDEITQILHANKVIRPTIRPPKGRAYVLCQIPMGSIELVQIGLAAAALERGNYDRHVLENFDRAVEDINSSRPKGRLVVLDGPPGTGKTYMVRAFMEAAPETKFVVVPPHLVSQLADPNIVITFIKEIHTADRPIVLILEDADQCLSTRRSENMASISAVLNLTDGIVGSLLDLRILATTNTPAQEFDAALLRKGRMSSHIKVGKLSGDVARDVWERLAGPSRPCPPDLLTGEKVLADVYARYNELSEVEHALDDISKLQKKLN